MIPQHYPIGLTCRLLNSVMFRYHSDLPLAAGTQLVLNDGRNIVPTCEQGQNNWYGSVGGIARKAQLTLRNGVLEIGKNFRVG